MSKQNILFVINTMGRAGAEMALVEMMKKLVATDEYNIDLYVIIPRGEMFSFLPPQVRVLNRKVSNGSVLSASARLFIAWCICKAFFRRKTGLKMLGELVRNATRQKEENGRVQAEKLVWRLLSAGAQAPGETYDLAVAYIEGAAAYYVADRVKAHHKATFIHIDCQHAGYQPWMDNGCYDAFEKIFVVSREVGRKFLEVYPQYQDRVEQFNNILDADGIRKKALANGFDDGFDGLRLVTVGRLHYQKGYDIAIEACALLKKRGYRFRWYVLGEGTERPKLEKLIAEQGVREDFILMGAKDNPYPYMRQADIYVHATRFEGKSIAIDEAQILARPIVASNCTGNTEQITDGVNGLLTELNPLNLADTLSRVMDDPVLRASLAEAAVNNQRDWKKDMEKLLCLIRPAQGKES